MFEAPTTLRSGNLLSTSFGADLPAGRQESGRSGNCSTSHDPTIGKFRVGGLNIRQKIALSGVVRRRYRLSSKKENTRILIEFIKNTGYNRSYARRILGSLKKQGRKKKHIVRKRIYDASVFYPYRCFPRLGGS